MPAAAPTTGRQPAALRPRRRPQSGARAQAFAAYVFSSGYVLLLLVFGVLPMVFALYLSFTKSGQFVGLDNYVKAVGDFRFLPAVQHVAAFLVIWVVTLTVLVTLLALIVHAVRVRWLSSTARFLFYIPGAFAGSASVMLWLFLLNPSVSPVSFVLKWFGYTNFVQAIDLNNLPLIFTVIAFWTGAGGWIIIMYGALNNISDEIMEAARCDGASAIKTAWYIQIPLISEVDRVHGRHLGRRRDPAVRGTQDPRPGEQEPDPEALFPQSTRIRHRIRPASGLQQLCRDLDTVAGRGGGACSVLRLPRRTL